MIVVGVYGLVAAWLQAIVGERRLTLCFISAPSWLRRGGGGGCACSFTATRFAVDYAVYVKSAPNKHIPDMRERVSTKCWTPLVKEASRGIWGVDACLCTFSKQSYGRCEWPSVVYIVVPCAADRASGSCYPIVERRLVVKGAVYQRHGRHVGQRTVFSE